MYTFVLFTLLVLGSAGAMVIQSHWEHVRLKAIPPVRVDGRAGGKVVLLCSATGSPAPKISWYKDNLFVSHMDWRVEEDVNSLGESVARLTIPCLSQRDAGVYECRARSGENQVSSVTTLNVVESEEDKKEGGVCADAGNISISMWRPTLLVEEGDIAILPCRVENDANGHQVRWTTADGRSSLENDVRYTLQDNGDLVIREVTFKDMGQYSCTVTGTGGTDTVHSFLYPLAADRNLISR